MRKIVLTFLSTVAAVVALFGYRTSTPHPAVASTTAVAAGSSDGSATTTTPAAPGSSASASRTVTGDAAQTRWGPVQVQITVADVRKAERRSNHGA